MITESSSGSVKLNRVAITPEIVNYLAGKPCVEISDCFNVELLRDVKCQHIKLDFMPSKTYRYVPNMTIYTKEEFELDFNDFGSLKRFVIHCSGCRLRIKKSIGSFAIIGICNVIDIHGAYIPKLRVHGASNLITGNAVVNMLDVSGRVRIACYMPYTHSAAFNVAQYMTNATMPEWNSRLADNRGDVSSVVDVDMCKNGIDSFLPKLTNVITFRCRVARLKLPVCMNDRASPTDDIEITRLREFVLESVF